MKDRLDNNVATHRVTEPSLSLNLYDVVGSDSREEFFIGHVGLAANSGSQQTGKISVIDMGPPLRGQNNPFQMSASVVGSANLTDDEVQKIQVFIDKHASEHEAFQQLSRGRESFNAIPKMYCIVPHVSRYKEKDGRYVRMRFSCVGFVFEAYKKARITLLNLGDLPMVDSEVIKLAYPNQIGMMESERIKVSPEDLGIGGDGPWRVMLCGYLFHALNRDNKVIRDQPYSPTLDDRNFT